MIVDTLNSTIVEILKYIQQNATEIICTKEVNEKYLNIWNEHHTNELKNQNLLALVSICKLNSRIAWEFLKKTNMVS